MMCRSLEDLVLISFYVFVVNYFIFLIKLTTFTLCLLTCVGLLFNFGKLMLAGLICNVDGLQGVGGSLRPCPLLGTRTG